MSRLGKSTACKSKHSNRLGAAESPAARLHSTLLLLRLNGAFCSSSSPAGAGHPVRLPPGLELSARLFGSQRSRLEAGERGVPAELCATWLEGQGAGRARSTPFCPRLPRAASSGHRDVWWELLAQQAGRNRAEKKAISEHFHESVPWFFFLGGRTSASREGSRAKPGLVSCPIWGLLMPRSCDHNAHSDNGAGFPPGPPHMLGLSCRLSAVFVASCWGASHLFYFFFLQLPQAHNDCLFWALIRRCFRAD